MQMFSWPPWDKSFPRVQGVPNKILYIPLNRRKERNDFEFPSDFIVFIRKSTQITARSIPTCCRLILKD